MAATSGFFILNRVDAVKKNIEHVKGTIDLCTCD